MYKSYNFLNLFNMMCGDSEVPKGYLGWVGISLIAAVLENRVWYEKFTGSKLIPNLYVFLVGPASVGKGTAISMGLKLLEKAELPINTFRGKTTSAFLLDLMGRPISKDGETVQPDSRLFLVMDELANDLGQVKQADDFIKMMTEMFTATDYPLNTGTRTDGYVSINAPCINWLVGTTKEWMFDVMTKQTIYSGFTARVMFCFRDYVDLRVPHPKQPKDFEEITKTLINKLRVLYSLEGRMQMDEGALKAHDEWYMNRVVPDEQLLIPAWKRGHDIILKLAMVFSLDENPQMIIRRHHFLKAQRTFDNAFKDLDKLVSLACGTQESEEIDAIAFYIKRFGKVNRTKLTRAMWHKKIRANRIDTYLKDLEERAMIKILPGKAGGKLYEWIG